MPSYKFTCNKTLDYDVTDRNRVILPKGTPNVEIAFGQSSKHKFDRHGNPTNEFQNVYRHNGKIYNA